MEETDAWEEGRAKEDGEWARGGGLPDGAPGPPAGWSGWPSACGVLVTRSSPAGRGWLGGPLPGAPPSHPGCGGHLTPSLSSRLPHVWTWNGIGSPLGWVVGAGAALPVGSAPSSSGREPAEGCGNKGSWARGVSRPLPGRGSAAREAFPARGQQRVGEQVALGGALSWEGCP